jgi:PAS domain-containing protein
MTLAGAAGSNPAETMVAAVLAAAAEGRGRLEEAVQSFDVPIYLTDAYGWVTAFNRACVDFAGRTPIHGQDRWCVTWRLYTEGGNYLPHDQCPMAVAVRDGRPVRDVIAIAERPDGARVMFVPYPTPILNEHGALVGAVNVLIDVTDERQASALEAQAERCRRLAASLSDQRTVATLTAMATEYESKAGELRRD